MPTACEEVSGVEGATLDISSLLTRMPQTEFHEHETAEGRSDQTCILDKPTIRKVTFSPTPLLPMCSRLIFGSDILAELDIPPSGIQEVQDAVQYPQTTMAPGSSSNGESEPSEIMVYYAAQLHMRKLLNNIQKELYQESRLNNHTTLSTIN